MLFECFPLGPLGANCYLLSGKDGHCVVVDPGEDSGFLTAFIENRGLFVDAILLTHCHYDHCGGAAQLHRRFGAPVYLHPAEKPIVGMMSHGFLPMETAAYPEILEKAGLTFTVYHTPGHSPGSVCLLTENYLLSGDTLFAGTCGRIDLPMGGWEDMKRSLAFLAALPGNPVVCPGHGESSRLQREKEENPYLREAMRI